MSASITCSNCRRTSYNLRDISEGYCGNCNQYFPDGIVRVGTPNEFVMHVWRDASIGIRLFNATIEHLGPVRTTDLADWENVFRVARQYL